MTSTNKVFLLMDLIILGWCKESKHFKLAFLPTLIITSLTSMVSFFPPNKYNLYMSFTLFISRTLQFVRILTPSAVSLSKEDVKI